MDEKAFKAHHKYVKGWSKADIQMKWLAIEQNPHAYPVEFGPDRKISVWVPKDKTKSFEDVLANSISSHRDLDVDPARSHELLHSQLGGIMPGEDARSLSGPATLPDAGSVLWSEPVTGPRCFLMSNSWMLESLNNNDS